MPIVSALSTASAKEAGTGQRSRASSPMNSAASPPHQAAISGVIPVMRQLRSTVIAKPLRRLFAVLFAGALDSRLAPLTCGRRARPEVGREARTLPLPGSVAARTVAEAMEGRLRITISPLTNLSVLQSTLRVKLMGVDGA